MSDPASHDSRREFIKHTATVAAGVSLLAGAILPKAHAAGTDEIRVAAIGCGGRGSGAVENVLNAAPNVKVVALADLFEDRLKEARANLAKTKFQVNVPNENCFTGFDAYKKVLALDEVNYVILATPPGFRSQHILAAAKAGKNIFAEKPVCVDGPTYRQCLEANAIVTEKKLAFGAGTQRRHSFGYKETIQHIHEGDLGEPILLRATWNQPGLWFRSLKEKQEQRWSDMEWQIRNWLYFVWLSGDHIVEQHVHNIDVCNWVMKDKPPARAVGVGGRQVRTAPDFGHIYDHFGIDYEYESGAHMLSFCRQQDSTDGSVAEHVHGTKGVSSKIGDFRILGEKKWKYEGKDSAHYVQEHTDLIASIRKGEPLNELPTIANSCMTAIMGRMAAYTGKIITWEQATNSTEVLMPPKLEFGSLPVPAVAMPGTKAPE